MLKGKEDFPYMSSETEACVFYCTSGAVGRNVIACRDQTKGNDEKCYSGGQNKYKNSNNDTSRALRWV